MREEVLKYEGTTCNLCSCGCPFVSNDWHVSRQIAHFRCDCNLPFRSRIANRQSEVLGVAMLLRFEKQFKPPFTYHAILNCDLGPLSTTSGVKSRQFRLCNSMIYNLEHSFMIGLLLVSSGRYDLRYRQHSLGQDSLGNAPGFPLE